MKSESMNNLDSSLTLGIIRVSGMVCQKHHQCTLGESLNRNSREQSYIKLEVFEETNDENLDVLMPFSLGT